MKALDFRYLTDTKRFPWFRVYHLQVDRAAAAEWFSREFRCPAHVEVVDGLGDADYWALECDCTLKIGFEFVHLGKGGLVYASEPIGQHVARHLSHWKDALHEVPAETMKPEYAGTIERFAATIPALNELAAFQLWRQGDDGNQIEIGTPTSRLNAECLLAELESHKHKQTYWISRVEKSKEPIGSH